jgi:hypothetical protein
VGDQEDKPEIKDADKAAVYQELLSTLDENDNPAPYTGNIKLSLNPVYGGEISSPANQISEGLYEISFTGETSIICPFTSTYEDNIDVIITASDPEGELADSNLVTISVTSTSIGVSNIRLRSTSRWGRRDLLFDFVVNGESIQLSEMGIYWYPLSGSPSRYLEIFRIWKNSKTYSNRIYREYPYSYSPVENYPITVNLSPSISKYIVQMDFNNVMDLTTWHYKIVFKDNSIPKKEYIIEFDF